MLHEPVVCWVLTFCISFQGTDNAIQQGPVVDRNTEVPSTQDMIALMSSSLPSQELSSDDVTNDNIVADEHNDPGVVMEVRARVINVTTSALSCKLSPRSIQDNIMVHSQLLQLTALLNSDELFSSSSHEVTNYTKKTIKNGYKSS